MISVPKGYTRALTIVDDVPYMGFYNEKGELVGFRRLITKEQFMDKLKRIENYKSPKYVPEDVTILQLECESLFLLMEDVFDMKQYALTVLKADPESESAKKMYTIATECEKVVESYAYFWASLHPLWMGHEHEGMKYHGANPYNFSDNSRVEYVRALAFGQKDFAVENILQGENCKTALEVDEQTKKEWDEKNKKVWDKLKEKEKIKQ